MAPKGRIYTTNLLQARERNGVIVGMRLEAVVIDLNIDDPSVLSTALDEATVPKYGDSLPAGWPLSYSSLILVERNVKIHDKDKSTAVIELVYETPTTSDAQNLDDGDAYGIVYGRMSASVHEVSTNMYYPNGNRRAPRRAIVVGHKYPTNDPHKAGKYESQGGTIRVMQPQLNYKFAGILTTNQPWSWAKSVVGKVNETLWAGELPREWMCMSASWVIVGYNAETNTNRYKFTVEMQHNPDTWDPTAVFIDERTHRPPVGLIEEGQALPAGQLEPGIKTIPYQDSAEFNDLFAVFFEMEGG